MIDTDVRECDMDVCACDIDVSLTDTHVIVSYRLSDSTDMHVSLIDTHVGTTLLTRMLKVLTWMSVWHLGRRFLDPQRVRNGRTTARGSARAAERARGGRRRRAARAASRLVAARSSSRWTLEMLAISSAVRDS